MADDIADSDNADNRTARIIHGAAVGVVAGAAVGAVVAFGTGPAMRAIGDATQPAPITSTTADGHRIIQPPQPSAFAAALSEIPGDGVQITGLNHAERGGVGKAVDAANTLEVEKDTSWIVPAGQVAAAAIGGGLIGGLIATRRNRPKGHATAVKVDNRQDGHTHHPGGATPALG